MDNKRLEDGHENGERFLRNVQSEYPRERHNGHKPEDVQIDCVTAIFGFPRKIEETNEVLKLYKYPEVSWSMDISPFPIKVLAYLRHAKIPYELVEGFEAHDKTKKIPWIDFEGVKTPDSDLIIARLCAEHDLNVDHWLTPEQNAVCRAFISMFETDFYWFVVWQRWVDEVAVLPAAYGFDADFVTRYLVFPIVKTDVTKAVWGQGTSRLERHQIVKRGIDMLTAFSDFLAEKEFFMGDKISSLDFTAFAFLANLIFAPFSKTNVAHFIRKKRPNLERYVQRCMLLWFPERMDWYQDNCMFETSEPGDK